MTDVHSQSADSVGAGAPAIVITSAMIQAGVIALCSYDSEFEGREECVKRIFLAMCGASEIDRMKTLGHCIGSESKSALL